MSNASFFVAWRRRCNLPLPNDPPLGTACRACSLIVRAHFHSVECARVSHASRHAGTNHAIVTAIEAVNAPVMQVHGGKKRPGNNGEPVTAELFPRRPEFPAPAQVTTSTMAPQSTQSTTSQTNANQVGERAERGEPAQRGDFVVFSGGHPIYFGDVTTVNGDLEAAARAKWNLYSERYVIPRDVFVPFVVGTFGHFGRDAKQFLKTVLGPTDSEDQQTRNTVLGHTARIQIAFQRGNAFMTNVLYPEACLRGAARAKSTSGGGGGGGDGVGSEH